jgi:hypothetical protein
MLRTDVEGFLVRDGWSIYRPFFDSPAPAMRGSSATALPEMILPAAKSEAESPCTVRPSCNEVCNGTLVLSKGRVAVTPGGREVQLDRGSCSISQYD